MYLADSIRHVSVCIELLPFQGNENFKCSAGKKMHLCFRVQANVIGSALIFIQVETLLLLLTPPILNLQETVMFLNLSNQIYLLILMKTDASNVVTVSTRWLNFFKPPFSVFFVTQLDQFFL